MNEEGPRGLDVNRKPNGFFARKLGTATKLVQSAASGLPTGRGIGEGVRKISEAFGYYKFTETCEIFGTELSFNYPDPEAVITVTECILKIGEEEVKLSLYGHEIKQIIKDIKNTKKGNESVIISTLNVKFSRQTRFKKYYLSKNDGKLELKSL